MAKGRDQVLQGPIGRAVLDLALPVIAGEALHTAFHIVDVAWVGFLGPWATGAIMTSIYALWIAFSLGNLVVIGLGAHVSRSIGAGEREKAGHVAAQALWLCLGLSALVMVLGSTGAEWLFGLIGTDARTSAAGASYLRIIALGAPFSFLYLACGAVMRASGNTVTPMLVTGGAVVGNIVLAPFLIFGWGPFPRLEVAGSAIATVLCMAGAVAVYGILIARGHPDLPLSRSSLRTVDWKTQTSLVKIGAPYCAIGILFSSVYLWYAHLVAFFGEVAVALVGIGNRLESITYLSADGFAVAASAFVGQNLGARAPDRAEKGAWSGARMMSLIGGAIGLVMLVAPTPLLLVFTRDAEAIRLGADYIRIIGLCQAFTGLEGVIGGGFAGAGDTIPPLAIHAAFALARFPLTYWAVFGLKLGVYGVAWTITLTCIVRAVVLALWFRRGTWKLHELPATRHPIPAAEEPEPTGV